MVFASGLNLVLLTVIGLYLLNDDDYREILIWSADYFLDGRLDIDGAFSVRIGHEVELTAEGVRLKAYDGSYDLSVARLNVEQRFGSYLTSGTLWINHLNMEDLQGDIRDTGGEEEFDWQAFSLPFVVIEEIQLNKLSLAYTEFDQQRHTIELSYISLDDTDNKGPVIVSIAGEINERPLRLEGTLGSLKQLRSGNQTYPVDLILSNDNGSNRQVIELDGTVGHTPSGSSQVDAIFDVNIPELVPIFDKEIVADKLGHLQGSFIVVEEGGRWRIRKTQFTATGTDAYQLRVGGTVENSGQFELHSEFGVPDPAGFGARFGIDLSRYAAFKGKGLISGNKNKLHYQGKMSVGRIESDTALTATLGGRKPQVKGELKIAELYLADIGIDQRLSLPVRASLKTGLATGEQSDSETSKSEIDTSVTAKPDVNANAKSETSAPASDDGQPLLDREPLDLSALQRVNLDLQVSIDQLTGADFSIDKVVSSINLNDSVLKISPLWVTLEGGKADINFAVDARNTPSVSLKVKGDDLRLGEVVPHTSPEFQLGGNAGLHIDIKSKGKSLHDLVSALSGDIKLDLDDVRLPRQYLEDISADDLELAAASDAYTLLEMDAAVSLKFGKEVALTAESVRVSTDDGSYDIKLGKLDMRPDLASYLEKGSLWFHKVNIADLHAEITDIETGEEPDPTEYDWHEFDWRVTHWPFILIEEMQFSNLSLIYTQDDEQDTYKLDSLVLDNDNSEEPMLFSAVGAVNAETLKLEGTVGTPEQPRGRNQAYPFDAALSHGNADAAPDAPVIKLVGKVDRTRPDTSLMQASIDVAVDELVATVIGERTADRMGHLQGNVTVADSDGRWGIRKLNLNSTDTDLYKLQLESVVDDSDTLDVRSVSEVPDPAAFGAQLGIDLTGVARYTGKGSITGTRTSLTYQTHETIGRIQSETTLSVTLVDGKPLFKGKFVIPNLYLTDIGLSGYLGVDPSAPETAANPHADEQAKPEEPSTAVADRQVIFSREPLDFSALQHLNLDVEFLIEDITGVDFSVEKLDGRIRLTDGVLRLSPLRMTFESGSTNLEFELDTRNTPSIILKVTADDLLLADLMARLQEEVPVKGKAHLKVDLTSSGHSPHELASDLSGKMSFSLENARVPKKYVEFLTADLFGFLFRSVTFEDSYATLHCVLTGLEVDQGVATTVLLFGEGNRLAVDGNATVDLGQETIDLVLLPKAKKRIGLDYSSITVKGPLLDPDVETTGTGAHTAAAVGGVLLIPKIIIPVFLVEQVWRFFSSDKDTGCSDYIEDHQVEIEEFKAR
jgi:uncharacterized protein involved in outer membrane biogenesis